MKAVMPMKKLDLYCVLKIQNCTGVLCGKRDLHDRPCRAMLTARIIYKEIPDERQNKNLRPH